MKYLHSLMPTSHPRRQYFFQKFVATVATFIQKCRILIKIAVFYTRIADNGKRASNALY